MNRPKRIDPEQQARYVVFVDATRHNRGLVGVHLITGRIYASGASFGGEMEINAAETVDASGAM